MRRKPQSTRRKRDGAPEFPSAGRDGFWFECQETLGCYEENTSRYSLLLHPTRRTFTRIRCAFPSAKAPPIIIIMAVLFGSKKVRDKSQQTNEVQRGWPKTLYEELRDMAAASFLVYVFGVLLEAARRHPSTFQGVEVQRLSGRIFRRSRSLPRTFTPEDVIQMIRQNYQLLREEFPSYFKNPENTLRSLELMRNRAELSGYKKSTPPLTLVEYDDRQ